MFKFSSTKPVWRAGLLGRQLGNHFSPGCVTAQAYESFLRINPHSVQWCLLQVPVCIGLQPYAYACVLRSKFHYYKWCLL